MPKRKTPRSKSAKPSKPVAHTPLALCDKLIPTQARRQQLELICQALEPLPNAVSITDPKQARLLYVNPAWQQLFHYSPAEALGRHPRFLYLADESDIKSPGWLKQEGNKLFATTAGLPLPPEWKR
jgi:PAS domain-containing protein